VNFALVTCSTSIIMSWPVPPTPEVPKLAFSGSFLPSAIMSSNVFHGESERTTMPIVYDDRPQM